ncbi:hypothetical protein CSA80_04760 [Candidatus Saccharibacteria bacterium]|nr:MAG: hypothetical protein CSA80_04760 [Candidatus Saccharibacteria bacterium]
MYIILLVITLAIAAYSALSGIKDYAQARKTKDRVRLYRRWIAQSWLIFAVPAVVFLLAADAPQYLVEPVMHAEFIDSQTFEGDADHVQGVITGLVIGVLLAIGIVTFRFRRGVKKRAEAPQELLVPTNRKERWLAAGMSVTAGITEELFFRALLPGLLFLITGDAVLAVTISIVIFGFEHIYAGWRAVLLTAVVGWVFFKVYMASGTILLPMAVHAILDINGLLVMPYLANKYRAKSGS